MKICPICQATTFDDAEVCYGCMHRFSDSDELVHCADDSPDAPVEFCIRFVPVQEPSGVFTWRCRVEA